MIANITKRYGLLALVVPLAFLSQGCNKMKSGRLSRAKVEFLGQQIVFSPEAQPDSVAPESPPTQSTPPPLTPPAEPTPHNGPAPYPSATPYSQAEVTSLPLKYVCSSDFSQRLGYNAKTAPELAAVFVAPEGTVECEYKNAGLRGSVINEKRLAFENLSSQCPTLARGRYTLWIGSRGKSPANAESMLALTGIDILPVPKLHDLEPNVHVERTVNGSMTVHWSSPPVNGTAYNGYIGEVPTILYDYGSENRTVEPSDYVECDMSVSPLVIHIPKPGSVPRDGPRIELTAPLSGVYFDILGRNSFPAAFAKKLISWFTPRSAQEIYFITLPNAQGEVNGIDQLFGNNTYGPDGRFAPNGYEALRKHDRVRDGEITRHDPVFRELRLWADSNLDGKAQLSELRRMEEFGIESIDLNYDPGYLERDKYGNETRMRSTATASGKRMYLVFDLWFRLVR